MSAVALMLELAEGLGGLRQVRQAGERRVGGRGRGGWGGVKDLETGRGGGEERRAARLADVPHLVEGWRICHPLNPPYLPHFTPLGLSAAQSCLAATRATMAPGSGLPQQMVQQLAMLMPQQVRERGEQGGEGNEGEEGDGTGGHCCRQGTAFTMGVEVPWDIPPCGCRIAGMSGALRFVIVFFCVSGASSAVWCLLCAPVVLLECSRSAPVVPPP